MMQHLEVERRESIKQLLKTVMTLPPKALDPDTRRVLSDNMLIEESTIPVMGKCNDYIDIIIVAQINALRQASFEIQRFKNRKIV